MKVKKSAKFYPNGVNATHVEKGQDYHPPNEWIKKDLIAAGVLAAEKKAKNTEKMENKSA